MNEPEYKDVRYSTRNPISAYLVKNFFGCLRQMLLQTGARRVLEIGCGEGFVTNLAKETLSPELLIGSDYSSQWLARAKKFHPDSQFMVIDARKIPFKDGAFDLVLAIEVLEHVEGPEAALDEIARVASNRAIISVPNGVIWRLGNMARGKYFSSFGNTPGHINEWSKRAFRRFLERRFEILEHKAPFPWQIALLKKK